MIFQIQSNMNICVYLLFLIKIVSSFDILRDPNDLMGNVAKFNQTYNVTGSSTTSSQNQSSSVYSTTTTQISIEYKKNKKAQNDILMNDDYSKNKRKHYVRFDVTKFSKNFKNVENRTTNSNQTTNTGLFHSSLRPEPEINVTMVNESQSKESCASDTCKVPDPSSTEKNYQVTQFQIVNIDPQYFVTNAQHTDVTDVFVEKKSTAPTITEKYFYYNKKMLEPLNILSADTLSKQTKPPTAENHYENEYLPTCKECALDVNNPDERTNLINSDLNTDIDNYDTTKNLQIYHAMRDKLNYVFKFRDSVGLTHLKKMINTRPLRKSLYTSHLMKSIEENAQAHPETVDVIKAYVEALIMENKRVKRNDPDASESELDLQEVIVEDPAAETRDELELIEVFKNNYDENIKTGDVNYQDDMNEAATEHIPNELIQPVSNDKVVETTYRKKD